MSDSVVVTHPIEQSGSLKRRREDTADSLSPKRQAPAKASSIRKDEPADSPEQVYNDSIKAVENDIKALDRRVYNQKWPDMNDLWTAVTTDNYASASTKHLGTVEKLANMEGGLPFAFNLTMALAEACHTNMDATAKISGWGSSIFSFRKLDAALVELIQRREQPETELESLPEVPRRWRYEDADVGVFKTGRPNKRQRDLMFKQEGEWEEERRKKRRIRRETTEDWVSVALAELEEQRDYLDTAGVVGYFPESIAALDDLLADEEDSSDNSLTGDGEDDDDDEEDE